MSRGIVDSGPQLVSVLTPLEVVSDTQCRGWHLFCAEPDVNVFSSGAPYCLCHSHSAW